MELDQRIKELRSQAAAATSQKARAEVELQVAESRRDSALQALHEEFGATTYDQARDLLKAAEDDLAAETVKLEKALEKAKGPE